MITAATLSSVMDVREHWKPRGEEVALIARSLHKIEAQHPSLKKMDGTVLGIVGHSFGAHTTLLTGGHNYGIDLKIAMEQALLALSPPGPNKLATSSPFQHITAPIMIVTGSKDNSPRTGQSYQVRLKTYEMLLSNFRYLLSMEDAEHSPGGIARSGGRGRGGGWQSM